MIVRTTVCLAGLAALAACNTSEDSGPGGVTVSEARALDEAAEMIDQRRTPAEVLAEEGTTDEESVDDAGG